MRKSGLQLGGCSIAVSCPMIIIRNMGNIVLRGLLWEYAVRTAATAAAMLILTISSIGRMNNVRPGNLAWTCLAPHLQTDDNLQNLTGGNTENQIRVDMR